MEAFYSQQEKQNATSRLFIWCWFGNIYKTFKDCKKVGNYLLNITSTLIFLLALLTRYQLQFLIY